MSDFSLPTPQSASFEVLATALPKPRRSLSWPVSLWGRLTVGQQTKPVDLLGGLEDMLGVKDPDVHTPRIVQSG